MEPKMKPLALNDSFRFSCSMQVPCFNECCRDLNQFLTPYDILRLKNRLNISSNLFLERYTIEQAGYDTGLPVISLKADHFHEERCPFVTFSGCSVYEDRPSSCRSYPLVRLYSRSRQTGTMSEQYFLLKEPHCFGFNEENIQTVKQWITDQGLGVYNRMNDLLMEIISLKNRFLPGQLDIKSKFIFRLACYDLDTFRSHVFNKGILEDFNLDTQTMNVIKNDDVELLRVSLDWLKHTLFSKISEANQF